MYDLAYGSCERQIDLGGREGLRQPDRISYEEIQTLYCIVRRLTIALMPLVRLCIDLQRDLRDRIIMVNDPRKRRFRG